MTEDHPCLKNKKRVARKSARINVRVTVTDKKVLERAAAAAGKTVSGYVVEIIKERAQPQRRNRRPISFYEQRAKDLGLTGSMGSEIFPNDPLRGKEIL